MQSVADRWYILYSQIATVLAVISIIASVVCWVVPGFNHYGDTFGLTYTTFALAGMQLLYMLLFYRRIFNLSSPWQATLFLALINVLSILNLIGSTGQLHSYYLISWALVVLASGMFGTYAVIGAGFFMTAYFILTTANNFQIHHTIPLESLLPVAGTYALAAISHYIWKNNYINSESRRVAQLSGALKNNQQQSEMLIQSIADGVIVINTEKKIILVNPVASAMTEWAIDEAQNIDVYSVVKLKSEDGKNDVEDADNPFVQVFEHKQHETKSLMLMGRNGKQTIVSMVVSPIMDPKTTEMTGAVAVLRDVSTARKEERQRADFISTASHEMRTPVAAIEGYLALALNEKVSKIDPKARDYLEKAHESTQHLGQLFQDLLTSAKAEDGRLVSHPTVIELGAYIEQLADSFRFSAQKKGLLTEFILGTASENAAGQASLGERVVRPLYYVHVDPDRLREVITNLFDNAVKYTPSGKISLGLTGNDEVVQMYIRDTGPGIPPEDVTHLFQKFYRVDSTATRTIGGTGLGLFICRKIVELYKGRIWVESEVGQGSTFYINLPRISTMKATELQRAEAQNLIPEPVSSLTSPV